MQPRGRRETVALMQGQDGFPGDAAAPPIGEDAARLAAERMAFAANALPALIAYVDATGRYVWVNLGYSRWFGRPTEEIVGRHASEILGAEAWAVLRPYVERVLAGEEVTFEHTAVRRAGVSRYLQTSYVPRPRWQRAGPRLRRAGDRHHRDEDGDGAAAERADAGAVAGDRAAGQLAGDPRRKAGRSTGDRCSGRARPTASSASIPARPSAAGRTFTGTCTPTTARRWRPGPPPPSSTSNRSSRSIASCAPTGACGSSTRAFSSNVRPTARRCARSAPARTSRSASRPIWRSVVRASNSSSSSTRRRPSSRVTTAPSDWSGPTRVTPRASARRPTSWLEAASSIWSARPPGA